MIANQVSREEAQEAQAEEQEAGKGSDNRPARRAWALGVLCELLFNPPSRRLWAPRTATTAACSPCASSRPIQDSHEEAQEAQGTSFSPARVLFLARKNEFANLQSRGPKVDQEAVFPA